MIIYPYRKGSKSVRALKDAIGIKSIKREGSRFKPRKHKAIVNWGSSSLPEGYDICQILNPPEAVQRASNKLQAFKFLQEGGSIPRWSESREDALEWLLEGKIVVCREVLNGHSGEGIVLASSEEELVEAPLYVEYIPKKEEYRVHVFKDETFFIQRKARKKEIEEVNWKIRNHKNGFIFANQDVQLPEKATDIAEKAVKALGLDFGAVDIIWNEKQDAYYVLEVNTAPGLTGTTLDRYCEKLNQFKGGW